MPRVWSLAPCVPVSDVADCDARDPQPVGASDAVARSVACDLALVADGTDGLSVVALVVAALALATGIAALVRRRRSS